MDEKEKERIAKRDAMAAHSARFILEEIRENGEHGIRELAKFTGYPEGVIAEALNNIFAK